MTYQVFCNGFWGGFHDKTNGVHEGFFLDLFRQTLQTKNVFITFEIEKANILLENVRATESLVGFKKWVHTFLFSGESYTVSNQDAYDCVLRCERNHKNVVNCPLFTVYLHCNFGGKLPIPLTHKAVPEACFNRGGWPSKDLLVLISNDCPGVRIDFCEELEKAGFQITYAGSYKNNIGGAFKPYMTSQDFLNLVKQHKFCLSMENSEGDTYITEKILHPLSAHTMPIYWGSPRILDYVEAERFFHVKGKESFGNVIQQMKAMTSGEWRVRTESPPLTPFGQSMNISSIARDVRALLFKGRFPLLQNFTFLCNPEFEPQRYGKLQELIKELRLSFDKVHYISPTYRHTITDLMYSQSFRDKSKLRWLSQFPLQKSELSLLLNWKAAFEHIEKRFSGDPDALFFIGESDVYAQANVLDFDAFLQGVKGGAWDACHVGGFVNPIGQQHYHPRMLPWRSDPSSYTPPPTPEGMFRKFHTRCTDSYIWTYRGIVMMLEHMKKNNDYNIPFDYYLSEFTYDNTNFRHCWSWPTFFDQRSNRGLEPSLIQTKC